MFVYARPQHTRLALDSLRANALAAQTDLIVFSDAARSPDKQAAVNAVRMLLQTIKGFRSVKIVERPTNLGLAGSIMQGVGEVLARYGRIIVVEDDLIVSPHFLQFMNDGLDIYADEQRVASIHGYCYPTGRTLPETFFLRGADCWGWATWSRAWTHFEPDGRKLRDGLRARRLESEFDFDGAYPYFRMLEDQIAGRNDSWAIRWHASCFLDDLLTLYPGRSLVHNIGNDGSGTHSGVTASYAQCLATARVPVEPQPAVPSADARRAFADYLSRERGLRNRLRGWFRQVLDGSARTWTAR
jgi:hypothetical protein